MSRRIGVLCLAALLQGCVSTKLVHGDQVAFGAEKGRVHKTWAHSIFWGLVPVKAVDLDGYCERTGVLQVRSHTGPVALLAQVVTLGVWTPSRVRITCVDAPPQPWVAQAEAEPWPEPVVAPEPAMAPEPEPAMAPEPVVAVAAPVPPTPPVAPAPVAPTPPAPAMTVVPPPSAPALGLPVDDRPTPGPVVVFEEPGGGLRIQRADGSTVIVPPA